MKRGQIYFSAPKINLSPFLEVLMPLFLIERNFAEQLDLTPDAAAGVKLVNDDVGVHWLYSFLSADKKKTYCLYEAATAEAVREAARRAGLPADVVVEVSELRPEAFLGAGAPASGA
jgi:hypothetical protein